MSAVVDVHTTVLPLALPWRIRRSRSRITRPRSAVRVWCFPPVRSCGPSGWRGGQMVKTVVLYLTRVSLNTQPSGLRFRALLNGDGERTVQLHKSLRFV